MALRFIDGFDTYTSDASVALRYSALPSSGSYYGIQSSSGRRGGGCLDLYSGSGYAGKTFDDQTTWTVGFALKVDSMPSSTTRLLQLRDSAGDAQCTLALTIAGALAVYRGGTSNTLLGTSSGSITTGAWYYIEMKVTIHDSTGSAVVRINETEVLSLSSVDTKYTTNAYAREVLLCGLPSIVHGYIDDLYVLDGTGSTVNFLGDVRVDALFPSGAGSVTEFTPSGAANNWDCVNDTDPDGDTTYTTATTVDDTDLLAFSDLSAVSGDIYGVQATLIARKDDAGTGGMKTTVLLNSTEYDGSEITMSDSYVSRQTIWEQNPDTAAAWAQSEINGAEFGYKVSS